MYSATDQLTDSDTGYTQFKLKFLRNFACKGFVSDKNLHRLVLQGEFRKYFGICTDVINLKQLSAIFCAYFSPTTHLSM